MAEAKIIIVQQTKTLCRNEYSMKFFQHSTQFKNYINWKNKYTDHDLDLLGQLVLRGHQNSKSYTLTAQYDTRPRMTGT